MPIDYDKTRKAVLETINKYAGNSNLQSGVVLRDACRVLGITLPDLPTEQIVLTIWDDMFRNGIIGWGFDVNNADPPFCHVTEHGRRTLANLSRGPANPDGYFAHLSTQCDYLNSATN